MGAPSRGAGPTWRALFFVGIALGAAIYAGLTGRWALSWSAPGLDPRFRRDSGSKLLLLLGAGGLIGFGARWAGGCTSGHGICGVGRLQKGSLLATATFVGTAVLTAQLVWRRDGTIAVRRSLLATTLLGIAFGFWLAWTRMTDFDQIVGALLLRRAYLWLMFATGVATTVLGLQLLRGAAAHRPGRTRAGELAGRCRPRDATWWGACCSASGWALAGACPGPIVAQVGMGRLSSLVTLAGLFLGIAAGRCAGPPVSAEPDAFALRRRDGGKACLVDACLVLTTCDSE